MEELVWMATVLRYGRQAVDLSKTSHATSMIHHANKPCPELAARMGNDAMDTVLQVSQSIETGKVEATL